MIDLFSEKGHLVKWIFDTDPEGKIDIFIKGLDGKTITINICQDYTIRDVKDIINNKIGLPSDDQQLVHNGKSLYDNNNVKNYYIVRHSTIHLVQSLRGC